MYTKNLQDRIWCVLWDHGLHKASNNSECSLANAAAGYSTEDPTEAEQRIPKTKIRHPGRREGWASTHSVLLLFTSHPAAAGTGPRTSSQVSGREESHRKQLTIAALTGAP